MTSRFVVLMLIQNSRNQVQVHVKHYYRATEVPDSVYLPLVNDRNAETSKYLSFSRRCIKGLVVLCLKGIMGSDGSILAVCFLSLN